MLTTGIIVQLIPVLSKILGRVSWFQGAAVSNLSFPFFARPKNC